MIRLGINGFGRIGRQVLKAVLERHPRSLRVVAVNDLFDVETNAHLFRYDTNYGRYPGEVRVRKDGFVIGGRTVKSLAFRDPAQIPWDDEGVEIGQGRIIRLRTPWLVAARLPSPQEPMSPAGKRALVLRKSACLSPSAIPPRLSIPQTPTSRSQRW